MSSTGLSLVGPFKVKALTPFLFTEGSFKVENKEHLFDFVVTLCLYIAKDYYKVIKLDCDSFSKCFLWNCQTELNPWSMIIQWPYKKQAKIKK